MKFVTRLTVIFLICAPLAHPQNLLSDVQTRSVPSPRAMLKPHQQLPPAAARPALPERIAAAVTPASNVTTVTCPEKNSVCGYVKVPLDRTQPNGTQISIYFEQYFHSNPGPAVSAIMMNLGGPGISTTVYRDYAQFRLFAPNLDVHDLLLVDDRGRGQSAAIDCPQLQHGTADFVTAERDCVAQLGAAASRYGTGDVAEDMNDVRRALGYELIDYLGASWGAADAIAFATRFPEHVRSLVLDGPTGPPNLIPYTRLQSFRTHSEPDVIEHLCARSLLCAADHPNPEEELVELIDTIRDQPIEGDGHDGNGKLVHVRIDERALLDFVVRGNFGTVNEVLAASASLERGDAAPLLRLAAEGFYTLQPGDSGDPSAFYSAGAFYATGCADVGEPWRWSQSVAERLEEDNEFLAGLPRDYFAPFSKAVGGDILFSVLGKQCLWWQKPTPSAPIAPRDADYPDVPTLVLSGDVDDVVPIAASRLVAELFPNESFVTVANSRHETTAYTQCARKLANHLIDTLSPGDTSCAKTPEYIYPALGRFPMLAKYARPAAIDPGGGNRISEDEREVVSVAVATAIDALQRSNIGSGTGVGLRGGTFQTAFLGGGAVSVITLADCAFSEDVIVNGTLTWAADYSVVADLSISGAATAGGKLHVNGFWNAPSGPLGNFQVSGTLGGKKVAVLVPEG
ncbi:MAG: alpha/beta hydrolase [Pseudomonadota bacterium]|nr:alpha/beta hydrolase [Pseudomonadota bacterium]